MSLFKTEEFWSTKCGQGETYITSSLCVANFFSNSNDQIITGSMNGYLRLFCPVTKQITNETLNPDGDNNNPFSIEKSNSLMDINIEYYLKQPIIQLEFGKFCYDSKLSLAVLNPNRLVLLEIDEETMSFKILEEFNLKRVAYNFCFGNFGRVSERDFICVQATDTTLSFYINGHLSFSCFLMDYLLPGPIQYVAEDDSIIIVNSNRYFQAYKYKNLAVSNSKNSNLSPMKTQKCATPDWEYNLGEDALELKVCDTSEQGNLILILCRYSLFIFNCKSRTAVKKRFETRCRLLICNGTVNGVEPRFLLSNSSNELMVFQNTTLKWKALMINPNVVDMKIGQFDGLKGYIVTLNETGNLVVLFLGTDPSTNTVLMPSNREIINENNEEELVRLHQKIKTLTSTNAVQPIAIKTSDLSKSVLLKLQIDYSSGMLKHTDNSNFLLSPEYSIDIKLKSSTDMRNVTVRVSTRLPIIAKQKLFHFKSINPDNRNNSVCNLHFLSNAAMVVCSLRVVVYVTYELIDTNSNSNSNNLCKISQTSFHLPLNLVVTSCAPVKQAKFKVTFDTTEEIANLGQIFSEFPPIKSSDEKLSAVAFAFQYYNDGPIVTILASCNTKRYRIQSDHFEAIWLILKELSNRLSQHFGPNFKIKYSEPLPLDSYFLVLDYHFSIRKTLNQFHNLLEERSKQFRAIEKLVLTKTKDKSLTPLQNLDTLLENSINQLMQLSDLIIEQEQHLVIVGNAVSSATSIISYLLQITGGSVSSSSSSSSLSSQQQQQQIIIQNALSGDFRDFPEIGLEELYEEIFVFLLKSVVNNNNNNNNKNNNNNQSKKEILKLLSDTKLFELPNNIDKLKKHIELFCERIGNGVQINVENQFSLSNTKLELNKEKGKKEKEKEEEEDDDDDESGDLMRKFVLTGHTGRNKTNKKSKKKKNLLLE